MRKHIWINIATINHTDFKHFSVISGPLISFPSFLSDGLCGKHDNVSAEIILLTFYVFNLTVVAMDVCGPMLNLFILYWGIHDIL